MDKREYMRKRRELCEQQKALEKMCKTMPSCKFSEERPTFNPNVVCKGCPLYPPYREIGRELEQTTKAYREAHNIDPERDAMDWIALAWERWKETAYKYGVDKRNFRARLNRGWTAEKAATSRLGKRGRKSKEEKL